MFAIFSSQFVTFNFADGHLQNRFPSTLLMQRTLHSIWHVFITQTMLLWRQVDIYLSPCCVGQLRYYGIRGINNRRFVTLLWGSAKVLWNQRDKQ